MLFTSRIQSGIRSYIPTFDVNEIENSENTHILDVPSGNAVTETERERNAYIRDDESRELLRDATVLVGNNIYDFVHVVTLYFVSA